MLSHESWQSYNGRDLPRAKIIEYAQQYDGVDMATLMGADDSHFPFLIQAGDNDYHLMFWTRSCGMISHVETDPVRAYAIARYLMEQAYPVFASVDEAAQYALEHNWPLGPFPEETSAEEAT